MRKTYFYNETTHEKTPATSNDNADRYIWHRMAVCWYNEGANVAIVDNETGEICAIWEH